MSTVVISIDGNDITEHVLFQRCSFEQSMNAVPGSFEIVVRNGPIGLTTFAIGTEISLDIDGIRMFGGYITQAALTFLAPAAQTSDEDEYAQLQAIVFRGTDYNIIFDRRVLRNTANYLRRIEIPITTDGAMLSEIVEDYTDCDDFTTTGITSAADIPGTGDDLLQQGIKLREPFQNYSFFGGTVWYIDGNKNFIYVPFEDVEKRWGFSDTPNHNPITASPAEYQGATTGFRQVEGSEDGTYIQNDVLIWGGSEFAGTGSTVFAREEDATSQSTYGRWQYAETHFGEQGYKIQDGVDARANVIVHGPPGADVYGQQKGLRYTQWQFTFTWFGVDVPLLSGTPDHLVPGDIVTIDVTAFGVTQLLPLRTLRTSFPNAFENDGEHLVQFDGTFGLQLSDPFTLWRFLIANKPITPTPPVVSAVNDDSPQTSYGAFGQFTPTPATDGSETVFSIPFGYVPGSLQVYQGTTGGPGALLLVNPTDYEETDYLSGTFTLTVAPPWTDYLVVLCYTLSGAASPPGDSPITVNSIPDLLTALADDGYDEIIVEDGTYTVDSALAMDTNSLYIGAAFASRTVPVVVHPETPGGVTFEAGGALVNALLIFQDGAHHQTWEGFHFADAIPDDTGTIVFGGDPTMAPPHHITMRNITLESTLLRNGSGDINAQGIYLAHALTTGPHDLLFEDITVDGTDSLCLWAGFQGYHGDATHPAPYNVTVRNLVIDGCIQAIVPWYSTSGSDMHDWLIDGATITNAAEYAVRFESVGASDITLKNMTSTGSGIAGFYSSLGSYPSSVPGVTFISDSFG